MTSLKKDKVAMEKIQFPHPKSLGQRKCSQNYFFLLQNQLEMRDRQVILHLYLHLQSISSERHISIFTFTTNMQWEAHFNIKIDNQYQVRCIFWHLHLRLISTERLIFTFTFTIDIQWEAHFDIYIHNHYQVGLRGIFWYLLL